jgi:dCMP deaminase
MAVHAEQNALLQCAQLFKAHTMYVSCTPCFTCAKMILNTPIKQVVVAGSYADDEGGKLLRRRGKLFMFDYETGNIEELT